MKTEFTPKGLPALIGSLPMEDHPAAVALMSRYTPDIPLWVQLPRFAEEGMMAQFLPGMPGLAANGERTYIHAAGSRFDEEMVSFFEEYMAVSEGAQNIAESRFALGTDTAPGFFEFMRYLDERKEPPAAIKAQITGPFTFSTGVVDQDGRALFYDAHLRDAAVKLIAMKARWQVNRLKTYGVPVIVFLDEPGLAGFGSSAFISVSRQDVDQCLGEVIEAVHEEGGIAGIHVCANSEWSIVLDSAADITSFDAYSFFDKFMLYADHLKEFMKQGGILAWGIVPTSDAQAVQNETVSSLLDLWKGEFRQVEALGLDPAAVFDKSLITPSCGTGSLGLEDAKRVLELTRDLSARLRETMQG
jgi:methionine synthase II (cobalamin-independent)